ncbi:hypothetical protein ES703_83563 [subsurface metagenome]
MLCDAVIMIPQSPLRILQDIARVGVVTMPTVLTLHPVLISPAINACSIGNAAVRISLPIITTPPLIYEPIAKPNFNAISGVK